MSGDRPLAASVKVHRMTAAHWFTQHEHGGVPVEKAALGTCDLGDGGFHVPMTYIPPRSGARHERAYRGALAASSQLVGTGAGRANAEVAARNAGIR
jgi:hypothetical protein